MFREARWGRRLKCKKKNTCRKGLEWTESPGEEGGGEKQERKWCPAKPCWGLRASLLDSNQAPNNICIHSYRELSCGWAATMTLGKHLKCFLLDSTNSRRPAIDSKVEKKQFCIQLCCRQSHVTGHRVCVTSDSANRCQQSPSLPPPQFVPVWESSGTTLYCCVLLPTQWDPGTDSDNTGL